MVHKQTLGALLPFFLVLFKLPLCDTVAFHQNFGSTTVLLGLDLAFGGSGNPAIVHSIQLHCSKEIILWLPSTHFILNTLENCVNILKMLSVKP